MQSDKASIFTKEQETELKRTKIYFPYRIVWGAVDINGKFVSGASHTMHKANAYVRKGWLVATII